MKPGEGLLQDNAGRYRENYMLNEPFYINNGMSATLEDMISRMDSLEEFERRFPAEFLQNDDHVGNYLQKLLWKYDRKASVISTEAYLTHSYVGNIVNGKKRNPSKIIERDMHGILY